MERRIGGGLEVWDGGSGRLTIALARTPCEREETSLEALARGECQGILVCHGARSRHGVSGHRQMADHEVAFLFEDGVVAEVARVKAGTDVLVHPRVAVRHLLRVPAGTVDTLGLRAGERLPFPLPLPLGLPGERPETTEEPSVEVDPWARPELVSRYAGRSHLYESMPFAAGATGLGWRYRMGPSAEALWLHAGGAYVIAPRIVDIAALRALGEDLGLAWIRLELLPSCAISERGGNRILTFDPQAPDLWMQAWLDLELFPTVGRWLMTRTLVVALDGPPEQVFQRLPTRIRYDIRAASRRAEARELAFTSRPAHRLDDRQWRAIETLHARWLDLHPGAEDNLAFCRPLLAPFGESMTAHLLWRCEAGEPVELLAAQFHVLWDRTNYYLFSETLPHAPNGSVHALIWHGALDAMARGADLLDLVSAFDPRYPAFRAHGENYTPMKLRWHPTTVWMPPSVAIPLTEMPP